jgi:glycosyltransferase involved in cell wall biosynthesis
MKKILHIAPNMTVKGGISTILKMYLKSGLSEKYDLGFIVTHEDGTKFHKFIIMLVGIAKFLYMLFTCPIDIAHIHCGDIPSPYRKYIFFKISRLFKLRVILHWHGGNFLDQYQRTPRLLKMRLRALFEGADVVICLSKAWSDALGKLFPNSNRIVVFNSILPPKLSKIENKNSREVTRIVFLGLLSNKKGFFDLLEVFEKLVKEEYNIELFIGGSGKTNKLEERIGRSALKNRIHYLGWINENQKDRLLISSDVFVLPSYGEAMPMSILEAMAYGLAVISTPVGSIPELVEDGVTGFLVKPGDLTGLHSRLKTLVEQRKLRIQMGRNGRLKVEKNFDIRQNYQFIGNIYNQLRSDQVSINAETTDH